MPISAPIIAQLDMYIKKFEGVVSSYNDSDKCHAKSYFACLIAAALNGQYKKPRLGCSLDEAFEYIAAHTEFCHRKCLEAALKIAGEPAERMQAAREYCCD